MSSRLVPFLLALSLLLNGFILAGFVYRTWIAPPEIARMGPPPGPGGPGRAGPLEMLSQDLKLDESQRQALKGLFDKYANERRERFRQIQQVREAMVSELKKPDFDMTQIDSLVDQMTKLRAEQQKENLGSIAQLSGQLRPDQRDRLHEILADRYGGPGNRPPGGPPRPPGADRPSQ